jgi:hypothetical protein
VKLLPAPNRTTGADPRTEASCGSCLCAFPSFFFWNRGRWRRLQAAKAPCPHERRWVCGGVLLWCGVCAGAKRTCQLPAVGAGTGSSSPGDVRECTFHARRRALPTALAVRRPCCKRAIEQADFARAGVLLQLPAPRAQSRRICACCTGCSALCQGAAAYRPRQPAGVTVWFSPRARGPPHAQLD